MMAMLPGSDSVRRAVPGFFSGAPTQARTCSCGKPMGPGGECDECRKRQEGGGLANGRPRGHDFARLALFDGRSKQAEERKKGGGAAPKGPAAPQEEKKAACSPTWYGETVPELSDESGRFTGRLLIKYNDAAIKSPCVKSCVKAHEEVHVKDLTPIVQRMAACDKAAGDDWDKRDRCNAMSMELARMTQRTECNAYQVSIGCLKRMLADAKGKCGKGADRAEVEAHLKREECHLRESCGAAGGKK